MFQRLTTRSWVPKTNRTHILRIMETGIQEQEWEEMYRRTWDVCYRACRDLGLSNELAVITAKATVTQLNRSDIDHMHQVRREQRLARQQSTMRHQEMKSRL